MALRFRVEMTKSTPRIAVLRIRFDGTGKEIKPSEHLGSFGLRHSPESIRNKLNDDEQYELDNFLGAIEFSKKFYDTEVHELDRFIIKVAPDFQADLFDLSKLARQYDLEFIPEKEMLYGVLNKAKEIEKKLNKLSGKTVNILEKHGINIDEMSDSLSPDLESKKLFEALLNLGLSEEALCKEFQDIAQNIYHKKTRFQPHFFKHYADPNNETSFPKWYYTIAIDVLQKHGVNPLKIISPQKVAKHWARLRTDQMSIDKAKQLFLTTFVPSKNVEKRCLEMINIAYLTYGKDKMD
jgi:hypothetical protein